MPFSANIFYRQYGEGKKGAGFPVILLHGGGATHMSWPTDIRRMPGHQIIAIDLPGHGKTALPACHSLESLVLKLKEFISSMGFLQVVLIGFSLGGALAVEFAKSFPSKVKGLALISVGYRFNIPEGIFSFLRPPANIQNAAEIFSQAAFHPGTPHSTRRLIIEPLYAVDPCVLAADFHIGLIFRFQPPEKEFIFPVCLIGGEQDKITPPSALRQLRHTIGNANLTILPDAGHMVIFEKTNVVKDVLEDFLNLIL